jgi:hypothetical protein
MNKINKICANKALSEDNGNQDENGQWQYYSAQDVLPNDPVNQKPLPQGSLQSFRQTQ